jgi:hypothetical protein
VERGKNRSYIAHMCDRMLTQRETLKFILIRAINMKVKMAITSMLHKLRRTLYNVVK